LDYTHRTYSKNLNENGNIYATYFYKYKVDLELSELIQDLSENVLSPQDIRDMRNDIDTDLENFSLKMIRIDWVKQSYQYRIKEILSWLDILGQPNEIYFLTNESSETNFIRFMWIFTNYNILLSIPEFEDKSNSPFDLKIYYPQFADEAEKMNLYTLREKYISENIQIEEKDLNDSFQEKLDEML